MPEKSAYSRATVAEIKKEARRMFPNMIAPITHILPRCYCVAKTAPGTAVFAVPEVDLDPLANNHGFVKSGWRSAKTRELEAGDWASLAYVFEGGQSDMEVILVHKRSAGMTFSNVPMGLLVDKKQKRGKKMSARKKGPAKAPKQKTVEAWKLSTLGMTAGGEKKYSVVIDNGILKTWVGFGWVGERKAQKKDYEQYPVVTRDGAP